MTGPRMTPEREAELRARHSEGVDRRGPYCRHCVTDWPCGTVEALDALAAERAHAQQVEVPHSSAAVLGYVGIYGEGNVLTTDMGAVAATREELDVDGDDQIVIAAVVRVGADGRIGS